MYDNNNKNNELDNCDSEDFKELLKSFTNNSLVDSNNMQAETCLFCVSKHLSQAYVLIVEAAQGYYMHRWIAVGHLAEAERECFIDYPQLANSIRALRAKMSNQNTFKYSPSEILMLLKIVREEAEIVNGYDEHTHFLSNFIESKTYK